MARPLRRLVLAYRPEGFRQLGGLQRIARELVAHLRRTRPHLSLATLSTTGGGVLGHTTPCRRLRPDDQLLIVGCDSPWAYSLAVRARLRGLPVSWLPSFHDPASAIHRRRALAAQRVLRTMQVLGVVMYVQTEHELQLLRHGRHPDHCRLSGHGLPAAIRQWLTNSGGSRSQSECPVDDSLDEKRPIDLLFLGRPTAQKGWPLFLEVAHATALRCEAIVPNWPNSSAGITLHLQPSDSDVQALLQQSKLVLIPANYESFGIAQLEALMAGCSVPILGHWPLWQGCEVLQWQSLDLSELAQQCRQLCANPSQLPRLRQQQLEHLRQHPILSTPVLPGLP